MAAKGGDKDDKKRPIIVKKVIKKGGGHHGGAWKVAYADFVTAMMAFFLLLWLLSTSSKATLEGIAEYFTPTSGIETDKRIGMEGMSQSINNQQSSTPAVIVGAPPAGTTNTEELSPVEAQKEANLFKQGETAINQAVQQDQQLSQYKDNIQVQQTPEGLKIDIMDSDKYPMFDVATSNLTEHGQTIISKMTGILKKMPNYMSITGHTDASPAETGKADYGNWELSSDRAQSARRFMIKSGMEQERPKKVTGMADQELLVPSEPRSPRNRRISIIMLKGSHIMIPDGAVPAEAPSSVGGNSP